MIALADAGFKVFRSRKIVQLRKMTGEFMLIFAGNRNARAIKSANSPGESGSGATAATGPGIQPCASFSCTLGEQHRPAPKIFRQWRCPDIRRRAPRSVDGGFRRASPTGRAARTPISSPAFRATRHRLVTTSPRSTDSALQLLRLSKSLSSKLTHKGRSSGTM